MIKYECRKCDGLICETSICPVCNERTYINKSEIFYCDNCNIPLFDKICPICNSEARYFGTDVRPVFAEERLLLECILDKPFAFAEKSVWNTSGNNYYVNGEKIKFVIKDVVNEKNADEIRAKIEQNKEKNKIYEDNFLKQKYIINFINANRIRYNSIVTEAHEYIKKISQKYDYDSMFVSFSGGKDSTVTSDLVINALNNEMIIHIYGDTTLEYPETGV